MQPNADFLLHVSLEIPLFILHLFYDFKPIANTNIDLNNNWIDKDNCRKLGLVSN
jgi:hypothetical protein